MLAGLIFLMVPLAVLVVVGVIAAARVPRRMWRWAAVLAVLSTVLWLVYVGLYQHETPCDGRGSRCPTAYGYVAPLPDEHVAGILLLLAGFVVPAAWVGWRRLVPPLTAGAALAVGPTVLALWTAPRGDNDGLWALIFLSLPVLGCVAAGVVTVADRVGAAQRRSPSRDGVLTVATPSDRLAALAIDVVIVGGILIVPLTALSHAKLEILAGVLGIVMATTYLAVRSQRRATLSGSPSSACSSLTPAQTGPSRLFGRLSGVSWSSWRWPSLSQPGGVNTHFDWPSVSGRQVLLFHASACDGLPYQRSSSPFPP